MKRPNPHRVSGVAPMQSGFLIVAAPNLMRFDCGTSSPSIIAPSSHLYPHHLDRLALFNT